MLAGQGPKGADGLQNTACSWGSEQVDLINRLESQVNTLVFHKLLVTVTVTVTVTKSAACGCVTY